MKMFLEILAAFAGILMCIFFLWDRYIKPEKVMTVTEAPRRRIQQEVGDRHIQRSDATPQSLYSPHPPPKADAQRSIHDQATREGQTSEREQQEQEELRRLKEEPAFPANRNIPDKTATPASPPVENPVTTSPKSTQVGDLVVTIKRIRVLLEGRVDVMVGVFNHSDKKLLLGVASKPTPELSDERGNTFQYESGLTIIYDMFFYKEGDASTLYPKSDINVILHFRAQKNAANTEEIGSLFALSLKLVSIDLKNAVRDTFDASFVDLTDVP